MTDWNSSEVTQSKKTVGLKIRRLLQTKLLILQQGGEEVKRFHSEAKQRNWKISSEANFWKLCASRRRRPEKQK